MLQKTMLAPRFIGDITSADVIDWLERRRRDTVRRKKRDADGRLIKVAVGRKRVAQHDDLPIGEKTVLNELMRISAVFEHARRDEHAGAGQSDHGCADQGSTQGDAAHATARAG